jgi:hypothetical protein
VFLKGEEEAHSMKRKALAALCLAVLLGMGTVGTAFAVILVRLQSETFSESSTFINTTTDGTGTVLRWTTSAPSTAMASVPYAPTASVEELKLYIRGASGGEDLAVFMDGTAAANKIGVVSDVTNSYALRTLAVNIPAGQHTFYFAPNSNLSSTQRILLDYVEFHDTDGTTTPAQCADGQDNDRDGSVDHPNDPGCSSPTDNDETNPPPPPQPSPSDARPGWGTGTAAECDVVVPAGTSNTALTNAVNSVPANLGGNHYVICMRGGNHGNYISIKPRTNTGDSASARLILKSYPGEQASLRGEVQPSTSYNFFTLRDFQIDGRFKRCANGSIPNPDCGGDTTNQGNPNMRPSLRVSGNAMEVINMDVAGGNDLPNGVGNNLNTRSTCIAYSQSPTNSLIEHSWIHNCGIPAAVSAGDADAQCIYTLNAGNGGIIRDNLIWDCAEAGILAFGSPGAKNMIIEDNILWRSGPNMGIGGASSGNTVRDSLFLDPTNGNNLRGTAPSTVTNNCLDSPINNSAVTTSGNVIVSPSQASVSGDPRNGNLTITAPSTCLAKYGGTWPIGT